MPHGGFSRGLLSTTAAFQSLSSYCNCGSFSGVKKNRKRLRNTEGAVKKKRGLGPRKERTLIPSVAGVCSRHLNSELRVYCPVKRQRTSGLHPRRLYSDLPFSHSLIYTPSYASSSPRGQPWRAAASPPQTVSSAYNNNVEGVWTGPLSHPTPPPRRTNNTNTPPNAAQAMQPTSRTHALPTHSPPRPPLLPCCPLPSALSIIFPM